MAKSLRAQLDNLKLTLKETTFPADSPLLSNILDIIAHFPGFVSDGERIEIEQLIKSCFSLTPDQSKDLAEKLRPVWEPEKVKCQFDDLVPKGWLKDYIDGTWDSESPTVFHFFCAATILGAMTDRRIWMSKGHYRIYPNLNVILIGPTGKVRKTAAINIASDIIRYAGYKKIILGQTTPESFLMSLGHNDPASCLVVGREMAAFFHKSKYMDGIVPLFTDLIDSPDSWSSMTIARGNLEIKNVMMSAMYGSTMDWLVTNMPIDIFGGGFMRRHFQVPQERSDRIAPLPADMDPAKRILADQLQKLSYYSGAVDFVPEARAWYIDWYVREKKKDDRGTEERYAGYLESKPDHLLRLAMLIQTSQGLHALSEESLHQALAIMEWLELFLPTTFSSMASTALGDMEEKIVKYVRNAGGRMSHSDLVRRMSKYMTASKLADMINTLKEAEMVEEVAKTTTEPRSYYLTKKSAGVTS